MTLYPYRIQFYILIILTVVVTVALSASHSLPVKAQEPVVETDPAVEKIFNTLTPAERVGQIFLVSFRGDDLEAEAGIARLIQTYRVGGVVISAKNGNFINDVDTPGQVLTLTNRLQTLAQRKPELPDEGPQPTVAAPLTTTLALTDSFTPLPLFIAVQHEGDGYPYTQIRNGLTNIPSQMAIGATWNPENARLVGQVVGQEISLLGINMLFGPSLDVLDNPRPNVGGSLGIRTFGGDPFWVQQMGEAYIRGVHQGGNHRLLTIATHFPGFGSSDREIDQAVPAIAKSLDDLRAVELAPFFHVTQLNPDDPTDIEGVTDGLMTAHIRYRGLQGNVPISLDARNLPAILALQEIAPWHEAGGLVVSAPLGAPAALEGIATGTEDFPARRLTQDAFLAGSDILLLNDFSFTAAPENEVANIINAIEFFQDKYANDPNFQANVDRAVRRIIKAKIKIYGPDLLEMEAQQPPKNLDLLNQITIELGQIAQAGVTLITPITQEGLNPLADPPQPGENILIVSDDRVAQDCLDCPEFSLIEPEVLRDVILQLFGPDATGQITPEQITSLSFTALKSAILPETGTEEGEEEGSAAPDPEIEALIESADWIIFAMLDIAPETTPQSDAVRLLLRDRYDTLRNKNMVLFAFNAPYFLDETEISQLTAYYGFYSKTSDYLEAAARLLFQQFEPTGAAPVSIPAIGMLDLSPDPNQSIQLEPIEWIDTEGNVTAIEPQEEPLTTLDLKVGEGIRFRTSIIVDRNGQPVPDGTGVNIFRVYPLENLPIAPLPADTIDGVATITVIKDRDTPLQVSASSGLAAESVPFNIGPGLIDTPTPTPTWTTTPTGTPMPTETATPTATFTPTPTVPPSPTPIPTPLPPPPPPPVPHPVDPIDLVYSLIGMVIIGGIAFTLGGDRFSLEERVRPTLVAIAFGLIGYIGYTIAAIAFPDSAYMQDLINRGTTGHWVAPLISLLFAIGGVVLWYLKPGRIFWIWPDKG